MTFTYLTRSLPARRSGNTFFAANTPSNFKLRHYRKLALNSRAMGLECAKQVPMKAREPYKSMRKNYFESGGVRYASSRPSYPPQLSEALVRLSTRTDHALDVGCGNGQLSRCLAEHFRKVTATDPSADQLAHAQKHPRVSYQVETAEKMSLPERSVDLITSAQAAHWFDLSAFYAEARRVARSGAKLALISYGVPELEGVIGAHFKAQYWGPFHAFWPEGRAHVEQGYQRIDFPFEETAVTGLVITRHWSLPELTAYIRTWSAAKRATAAGQGRILEGFIESLAESWGAPGQRKKIIWPITCRVGQL